jgi:hypothetical protein
MRYAKDKVESDPINPSEAEKQYNFITSGEYRSFEIDRLTFTNGDKKYKIDDEGLLKLMQAALRYTNFEKYVSKMEQVEHIVDEIREKEPIRSAMDESGRLNYEKFVVYNYFYRLVTYLMKEATLSSTEQLVLAERLIDTVFPTKRGKEQDGYGTKEYYDAALLRLKTNPMLYENWLLKKKD